MTETQGRKLGRQPPRLDHRTLRLARYLTSALAPPPETLVLSDRVSSWPMYANDRLGCCTCASAGHLVEVWSAMRGREIVPAEADVVSMYEAITGGQDTGAVELDVLNYWRKHQLAGESPFAFVTVNPKSIDMVKVGASLFGGLYLGIELPISAEAQVGQVWDVPAGGATGDGAAGTWGGHSVNLVDYDPKGFVVVTWGQVQRCTWAFWDAYVDEAWAVLPSKWSSGPLAAGVDFQQLEVDLLQVGQQPP